MLRDKHSLRGRSITPLVKRLRDPERVRGNLARLKRTHPTENMDLENLGRAVKNITGEDAQDIWAMAGHDQDPTEDDMRLVLHYTITTANELGQVLKEDQVLLIFKIWVTQINHGTWM